jgi:hypothetical protein
MERKGKCGSLGLELVANVGQLSLGVVQAIAQHVDVGMQPNLLQVAFRQPLFKITNVFLATLQKALAFL